MLREANGRGAVFFSSRTASSEWLGPEGADPLVFWLYFGFMGLPWLAVWGYYRNAMGLLWAMLWDCYGTVMGLLWGFCGASIARVLVGFLLRGRHGGDLEATGFKDNYCAGGNSPPALPYTGKKHFLARLILLIG